MAILLAIFWYGDLCAENMLPLNRSMPLSVFGHASVKTGVMVKISLSVFRFIDYVATRGSFDRF